MKWRNSVKITWTVLPLPKLCICLSRTLRPFSDFFLSRFLFLSINHWWGAVGYMPFIAHVKYFHFTHPIVSCRWWETSYPRRPMTCIPRRIHTSVWTAVSRWVSLSRKSAFGFAVALIFDHWPWIHFQQCLLHNDEDLCQVSLKSLHALSTEIPCHAK